MLQNIKVIIPYKEGGMYMLMEIAGYLGISSGVAKKVVDAIDAGAAAFIIMSILTTIISAGSLAAVSASVDFVILTVKNYIARSLKAQAIIW